MLRAFVAGLGSLLAASIGSAASAQVSITCGSSLTTYLDAGAVHQFQFSVASDDAVAIDGVGISGTTFVKMQVFGPNGTPLNGGGTCEGRIEMDDLQAGSYLLLVSDCFGSGSGTYALTLNGISATFNGGANCASEALTASAHIDAGLVKAHKVTTAPGRLRVIASTNETQTIGLEIRVYSPSGERLTKEPLCQRQASAEVEVSAGVHTVLIDTCDTKAVDYSITILPPAGSGTPTPTRTALPTQVPSTPTATPTATATPIPASPTASRTPSRTASPTTTASATGTPTAPRTATPTITSTSSPTPPPSPTITSTLTATLTPVASSSPSPSPSLTATASPSATGVPTSSTATPSATPASAASVTATSTATTTATARPTTPPPTFTATASPTPSATATPTASATTTATARPTTPLPTFTATASRTPFATATRTAPEATATANPSATYTPSFALTPTASPTGTYPSATPTATPSSTVTAAPSPPCTGDCGDDGIVTVDEILKMVAISLANDPPAACRNGDANHDGVVTVDEIVTAVRQSLNGCPAAL